MKRIYIGLTVGLEEGGYITATAGNVIISVKEMQELNIVPADEKMIVIDSEIYSYYELEELVRLGKAMQENEYCKAVKEPDEALAKINKITEGHINVL